MKPQHRWLAADAAAVIATAPLAACGSSATPAGPATSAPPASAASTPAAAFNTADVAFTTGMLRLETQSTAMAALVAGHATSTWLRQFAGHLREHGSDAQHMRDPMGGWHQPAPSPYTPAPPCRPGWART
ncbi:MAG TPA: hypothetical protein VMV92_36585 [Streptosporangiaceae bacterium]|nr:hypothetical protein [Streptosporangiaceae bacterium]